MNSVRSLLIVNAVIAIAFALGLLLGPAPLLQAIGLTTGNTEKLVAQLFGGSLIAVGLISWMAKDFSDPKARDGAVISFLLSDIVGFVISLLATIAHTMRNFGWLVVVIYLLLALGFAYFQFFHREA